MKFSDCMSRVGGLAATGFSEQAARLVQQVSGETRASPELLAITWMNESTFKLRPLPNANGFLDDVQRWDVGPFQLNVLWTRKCIIKKEVRPRPEHLMFGTLEAGRPEAFNGDPLENARMAADRLLARHGDWKKLGYQSLEELQAVVYTGPLAQPHRLISYRTFAPGFKQFFRYFGDV